MFQSLLHHCLDNNFQINLMLRTKQLFCMKMNRRGEEEKENVCNFFCLLLSILLILYSFRDEFSYSYRLTNGICFHTSICLEINVWAKIIIDVCLLRLFFVFISCTQTPWVLFRVAVFFRCFSHRINVSGNNNTNANS